MRSGKLSLCGVDVECEKRPQQIVRPSSHREFSVQLQDSRIAPLAAKKDSNGRTPKSSTVGGAEK